MVQCNLTIQAFSTLLHIATVQDWGQTTCFALSLNLVGKQSLWITLASTCYMQIWIFISS